jgi:hypothetical protein
MLPLKRSFNEKYSWKTDSSFYFLREWDVTTLPGGT